MKSIQEVFTKIKEISQEQKDIRKQYRDALTEADGHEETVEKLDELKQKKKQIEQQVQSEMGSRWNKLDELKDKVTELKQAQSDIAISAVMDGKTVEVKDEFDNIYEPLFSVSFKKSNAKNIPGLIE